MNINKRLIAFILVSSLIFTGCSNSNTLEDSNLVIQNIASDNFNKYIEQYGKQNLKEITEDTELSETEQALYKFLVALNNKDYSVAMRLSNYYDQPFVTEEDFKNGLSLNDDPKYNYASIVSKDLNKNLKISVTPVEGNPDIMFTSVIIDNNDEFNGSLVRINNTWKVAITGLRECTFEVPTNEKLVINGLKIDEKYKVSSQNNIDTYKVNLLNDNRPKSDKTEPLIYNTTVSCVSSVLSGNLGDNKNTIEFHLVCTDKEIDEFMKWEIDFYNNMYKDAIAGNDLSKYFTNEELIETTKNAINVQKSKKINNIVITKLFPTTYLDAPIKKIDNNTIEAHVTIVISYVYYDKSGKTHTKEGVSDTQTCAVFKRDSENASWKMDSILGTDPILKNSKFGNI